MNRAVSGHWLSPSFGAAGTVKRKIVPPPGLVSQLQSAAVRLDNRAANREAETHAVGLGGNEGFEQLAGDAVGKARSAVGDGDLHHALITQGRRHVELAPSACFHRLDGIAHEIDEDLLDLDPVDEHVRGVRLEMQPHLDAERAGPRQGKRTSLLDHR